jgi:hypothetical protein
MLAAYGYMQVSPLHTYPSLTHPQHVVCGMAWIESVCLGHTRKGTRHVTHIITHMTSPRFPPM